LRTQIAIAKNDIVGGLTEHVLCLTKCLGTVYVERGAYRSKSVLEDYCEVIFADNHQQSHQHLHRMPRISILPKSTADIKFPQNDVDNEVDDRRS